MYAGFQKFFTFARVFWSYTSAEAAAMNIGPQRVNSWKRVVFWGSLFSMTKCEYLFREYGARRVGSVLSIYFGFRVVDFFQIFNKTTPKKPFMQIYSDLSLLSAW